MSKKQKPIVHTEAEGNLSFERIVFFSDAVCAIAITLLALEIRVPDVENVAELGDAILSLTPAIFVFILSFVQVGLFWYAHHRLFRSIKRYDDRLIWLNILFLLLVAFLPVPSATVGRYGAERPAVIFFAACLCLLGFAELLLWRYASKDYRLIDEHLPSYEIRHVYVRIMTVIGIFLLSILIAFVSPQLAMLSWLLILFVQVALARLFHHPS